MQPTHPQLDPVVHAARQLVETVLGPWGGAAACIDAYESAVRSAAQAQVNAAQALHLHPARSIVSLCAELTRDVGAIQISTARWILDA
jgi:hypothetical protein